MSYRLTDVAEHDIRNIVRDTLKMFGVRQVEAYRNILLRAFEMLAENPLRFNSTDRSDLYPGVRMMHLQVAAGRRGGAAHCVYYLARHPSDASSAVLILRVLHEHMEPRNRVVRTLASVTKNDHH